MKVTAETKGIVSILQIMYLLNENGKMVRNIKPYKGEKLPEKYVRSTQKLTQLFITIGESGITCMT